MKFYIACFGDLKSMDKTCIPISTAMWQPKFFKIGLDKKEVMLGITERELSPYKLAGANVCQKDCPYRKDVPECPFLTKYRAYLDTVDFNYIYSECSRVAEDVRKITHYEGEPNIVLLVYEAEGNPCSERIPLIEYFASHGIELKNWKANTVEFPIEEDELPF